MQTRPILPGSPEWNYAQFRFQLILSHPNIEILSIERNPAIHNFFQTKEQYFKIDAAVDVSEQTEGQVHYYKNNLKKGSVFNCGRMDQDCQFEDGMGSAKVFRVLLFKIAVKNTLPIYQSKSLTKQDLTSFTEQNDSVYIASKNQQMSVFDHHYFVKSTSQYCWEFDVQYRYINANEPAAKIKSWNPQEQKCQECLNSNAYWYCVEEKQLFCRDCFEDTHKGKFRKPHQKELLSPFNSHKTCHKPAHNQNPLEFYCLNCNALKCLKCLSDSHHNLNRQLSNKASFSQRSSEDLGLRRGGQHQFIPVRQLVKMYQQKQQQTLNEIKQKLLLRIKQVEEVISEKSKKYNQKLKKLQEELAQAIFELKVQSRKQVNEAVSVQIQLKRKFDETIWIEKFVSYNEDALDAQSNIRLKQVYAQFLTFMNAQQYFKRIDQKVASMQQSTN